VRASIGWMTISKKLGPLDRAFAQRSEATTKRRQPKSERAFQRPGDDSIETLAVRFLGQVERGSEELYDDEEAQQAYSDPRVALIAQSIARLKIDRIQEVLGGGSFGTAAALSEDLVLKLTTDPTEVQAGAVLRGKDLPHVVRIDGSWFIKGVIVNAAIGWDAEQEEEIRENMRVGVLLEQRVEPIERSIGDNLSKIVNRVKTDEQAWPGDLFTISPGKARIKLRHVSEVMEGAMRAYADGGRMGARAARDVAEALHELREQGVYAIDVHGGNVGHDDMAGRYRVFDIGSTSPPRKPKAPTLAPGRVNKQKAPLKVAPGPEQLRLPYISEGVYVSEL